MKLAKTVLGLVAATFILAGCFDSTTPATTSQNAPTGVSAPATDTAATAQPATAQPQAQQAQEGQAAQTSPKAE